MNHDKSGEFLAEFKKTWSEIQTMLKGKPGLDKIFITTKETQYSKKQEASK